MCDNCRNHSKSFITGTLIGAALGAALGLLFAPDSGEATRKKIKQKSKDYIDEGKEMLYNLDDTIAEARERFAAAIENAEDEGAEVKEQLKEKINKLGEQLEETAGELKDKVSKKKFFRGLGGPSAGTN